MIESSALIVLSNKKNIESKGKRYDRWMTLTKSPMRRRPCIRIEFATFVVRQNIFAEIAQRSPESNADNDKEKDKETSTWANIAHVSAFMHSE